MSTTIEKLLKDHKLRKTEIRIKVLELFMSEDRALSQNDIEAKLLEADRITLYRTLKSFEKNGLIHKAIDGSERMKFALCSFDSNKKNGHKDKHAHFHCNSCGQTFCLESVSTPDVVVPKGYIVDTSHLVLNGRCEKCS
ncbi:MAG: transcriptional repressor [Bacteroidota bacterium]